MRRFVSAMTFFGIVPLLALLTHTAPAAERPTVVVRGPTVVACFVPVSDAQMEKNPDLNETLADFQLYTAQARRPLQQRGISFRVLSARSFRIQVDGKVVSARVGGAAYYFIAPGRKPLMKTGVMTDADLVTAADEYFGKALH